MRYERLLGLGAGGMASVELALAIGPSGFNRLVVLKSMRKELAGSEEAYGMFLAEARLSARLSHPNVVQVTEVLDTPEGVVLVMEYLDGLSLSGAYRAANEALTLPMRLRIICEVLMGLEYAHGLTDFQGRPLGIVHRDVSPQNVFLTYDGRVKLLDFGIAKAASSEQTRAGMVKGRLAYMPAEQLRAGAVDRRTDIYSVGCLLWEAIAGGRIWQDQTERDIARGVLSGRLPPLSSRVKVAPELERIVAKATSFEPDQRYPTADAMRADLDQYLMATRDVVSARDIGDTLSRISVVAREQRQRAISDVIAALGLDARDGTSTATSATGLRRAVSVVRTKVDVSQPALSPGEGTPVAQSGDRAVGAPARSYTPPGTGKYSTSPGSVRTGSQRAPRSRLPLIVAVVGVASVAAFFGFARYGRDASNERAAVSTPLPVITSHSLRISARPSDARVFVDGAEIPGIPAVVNVPTGSEHAVRVEREGYETSERTIRVSENVELDIELSAKPSAIAPASAPADKPKAGARVAPQRAVAAPAKALPAQKNCDPPYYFVNGNKTYKPECI
jgi:serine/threonine-protein kinase